MADILRQRHLLRDDMCSALKFVVFVENFVKDSSGSQPKLTLEQVCQWSLIQRRIYLAEAFLQTKSIHFLLCVPILCRNTYQVTMCY